MQKDLDLLIELQGLDTKIGVIDEKLESLPVLIQQHYSATNRAKEEYDNFLKGVEADKKLRIQKEGDVRTKEEGMAKAKNKLHEIKTNQEYKAALKEIENITRDISKLEDEQLELMEKVEESKETDKTLKVKVEKEEGEFQKIKVEKEAEIEKIKEEKGGLVSQRDQFVSQIDPKLMAHYNKVHAARGGKAVAELKNGYCTACHTAVLPQLSVEVRTMTHIHTCPHCIRFLYMLKEEKAGKKIAS